MALVLVTAGCGGGTDDGAGAQPRPTAEVRTPALERVLSVYLGDLEGLRDGLPLDDGTGRVFGARLRVQGDPTALRLVDGPHSDEVLHFPADCDGGGECPRSIVEVMDEDELSPAERDFRLTAVLRMAPDETSKGANVAQKGFSTGGGGQWKLQVDGSEGLPSCVVAATSRPGPGQVRPEAQRHVVTASVTVADDRWHEVSCERVHGRLRVVVDGQVVGSLELPDGVDVQPVGPVRIGGKNLRQDNDQFSGAVERITLDVVPAADR